MKKNLIEVPNKELEIMQIIWENETPISTKRICDIMNEGAKKPYKLQALQVLLNRLIDKGFLSTFKENGQKYYVLQVQKEEYLNFVTKGFVKRLYNNSVASFISTLLNTNSLKEEDVEELTQILSNKKE